MHGSNGNATVTVVMQALKAHMKDGQVVLDEPVDLPDGTALTVIVGAEDQMTADERAALERAIEEGYEDFENGDYEDARALSKRLLANV